MELYLFSGAHSLLFAKLTEDQMICKSSRPWNFVELFFQTSFRLDILYYINFFQSFFIRNFTLLFTFVFFHNYSTLIYLSTLADFPFSVRPGSGYRRTFDPRPSLIWNTGLTTLIIQSISLTTVIIQSISLNNCKRERLKIFAFIVQHINNLLFHSFG